MNQYLFQTADLRKQIQELRGMIETDSVQNALREVKEYAAKSNELNVDTLQLKLMHLDDMGRRTRHEDRELFSSVLQRFLCHKSNPKIGFLVSSLLCTPAESKVFEKEQKFLKIHGNQESNKKTEETQQSDQFQTFMKFMQSFQSLAPTPFRPPPPYLRPTPPPRRFNSLPRKPYTYSGCHICGEKSHFATDCTKK